MAKKKAAETKEDATPAAAAPAPKKKAPAAAAAKGKKAPAAKPAAGGGTGGPHIDTNLAATNAAKMLLSKSKMGDQPTGAAQPAVKESGAFKQMKDALKKPGTTGLNAAL